MALYILSYRYACTHLVPVIIRLINDKSCVRPYPSFRLATIASYTDFTYLTYLVSGQVTP